MKDIYRKEKTAILILISAFALTSCAISKPDILAPLQTKAGAQIIGIKVEPPFNVTFYTDKEMTAEEKKLMADSFLAAIVIPEGDLWVNLKIKEKDRITPYSLGVTELGRVMLEQDYLLKKAVSTAMYPESDSGYRFWNRIAFYGPRMKSDIRTWIYPKKTVIVDNGMEMLIKSAELDVKQEKIFDGVQGFAETVEEIILPEVKNRVLYSAEFVPTRQVYRAVICGIWFKNKFLNTIYVYSINTNKTGCFEISDKDMKYKVFEKYAYSYRNQDWQNREGKTWGGIDFKKPSAWIGVEKGDFSNEVKDADKFKIVLHPSDIPSSEGLDEKVVRSKIGGIDLGARIEVEEAYFDVFDSDAAQWQLSQSIGYIIFG